jgi:hypothetical protein
MGCPCTGIRVIALPRKSPGAAYRLSIQRRIACSDYHRRMGVDETSADDEPTWTVFVDRRGGRIVLVGHYGSKRYDSAHLDHEASDGSIRVWRNESNALVAAEATIAHYTDDPHLQLHEFRSAVERLQHVADADDRWFEPVDLIRLIPFDDEGAQSFITYGRGRAKTSTEREEENDAAFMAALNQVQANQARRQK